MELQLEEKKKMLATLEQVPHPEFEGVSYPSFIPFRKKGAKNVIEDIMNVKSRDSDIIICTYAKSGTHWTYEIVNMLLRNTTELDKNSKIQAMLEAVDDLSVLDSVPSPRIMDTHCLFKYIPKQHRENKGKIVHMIRNPKDVCVSYYYHCLKDVFINFDGTWEEFLELFMSGKLPYGTWYNYELEIERAARDFPGMIFTCYYEDMKQEPVREIKKLADFLGIACSNDTLEKIAKKTSFENMQKNKFDFTEIVDGKGFIYRKGEIGDWKNHFTVKQNEKFDAQFKEEMKDSRYKITFE
ncbi:SULT1 [Mytilus coruscus]|uniref:SULT1 n=1 Tax=Mytilus coruscus TaxID=42192 RepID=A0A6J8E0Y4_MYTCO|nr:SULT1 [Mytilus coruscus]